jgi:20S proteasome alpha/beta subunit
MSIEEGVALAVQALKKALGEGFKENRLDGAYITIKDKVFTKLKKRDIEKVLAKK